MGGYPASHYEAGVVTIQEVAVRAGVSIGTVSNVLANSPSVKPELRARVELAIRELNYHPNHTARNLASRSTKTIGIVISDITNPFFPLLVRKPKTWRCNTGISSPFKIRTISWRERSDLSLVLRSRGADGALLVCAPNLTGDVQHLHAAAEAGLQIVCLDRLPSGFACDAVIADNSKGARLCVRHLHLLGNRHIAAVLGPPGLQNSEQRTKSYREALKECGIPCDPKLERQGDFRLEAGHRLAKDLLLSEFPPTAILPLIA